MSISTYGILFKPNCNLYNHCVSKMCSNCIRNLNNKMLTDNFKTKIYSNELIKGKITSICILDEYANLT